MRYLGIDYGLRRIGVAVSDKEGRIAFPHSTIRREGDEDALREIAALAKRENAEALVMGVPLAFSGDETEVSVAARAFGARLKGMAEIPIFFENEALTTRMARASGADTEHKDQSAAAIILQSYLDKQQET
ncbi:MAG: Holliday junction resolvase RuvX, partial [Candidatus Sungbacteria bacterium]|nr:Holliday junction resolvase RuvX [Candidatus Sungbacteria bacterium]